MGDIIIIERRQFRLVGTKGYGSLTAGIRLAQEDIANGLGFTLTSYPYIE